MCIRDRFSTAQLLKQACARFYRIEPKSVKNGIDARSKRISAFSIDFLQVPVVTGKHRRCGSLSKLSDLYRLFSQGLLEREQICERASSRFPYRRCFTKVAMLFEK